MSDRPTLLPPNATEQELAIEQSTGRVEDVPVPIKTLWNPDTCPVELLPWLAWAMSIDTWKFYWPESVKREHIRQAVALQRKKGTTASVRGVVQSFGGDIALQEWWQTIPKGVPHTFHVSLTVGSSVPATPEYQQDIIDEITRTKPVRSHFTFDVIQSGQAGLGLQGAARPIIYRRLSTTGA